MEDSKSETESASQSQSEEPLTNCANYSPTDITKTEDAELDEALDDLKPPKVAESVAPKYFHDFEVVKRTHSK